MDLFEQYMEIERQHIEDVKAALETSELKQWFCSVYMEATDRTDKCLIKAAYWFDKGDYDISHYKLESFRSYIKRYFKDHPHETLYLSVHVAGFNHNRIDYTYELKDTEDTTFME